MTNVRSRRFFIVGLLVTLLVAGVGSYYASAHPDGLEYVAEQTGFIDAAEDSATVDSPLADYQTSGVDDTRLSGGLAGVIGPLCASIQHVEPWLTLHGLRIVYERNLP